LQDKIEEAQEDEFFMGAAQRLLSDNTQGSQSQNSNSKMNQSNGGNEIQKLREENKRLKRTLSERFDAVFE